MKRIMALAATVSVLTLFALAGPAGAQDGPTVEADPAAVAGPGEYSFTLSGSGWTAGNTLFIVPCTSSGEQLTTATPVSEIIEAVDSMGEDDCELVPMAQAIVGSDGTFTVEVTADVTANFAFGVGNFPTTEESGVPVLFIADDMGDGMMPVGGADTGFGGAAGAAGAAAPLTAALVGATLLGGAALLVRRNASA